MTKIPLPFNALAKSLIPEACTLCIFSAVNDAQFRQRWTAEPPQNVQFRACRHMANFDNKPGVVLRSAIGGGDCVEQDWFVPADPAYNGMTLDEILKRERFKRALSTKGE